MNIKNPFATWSRFEWWLWSISTAVIALSYLLSPVGNPFSMVASLIGVLALMFLAKGHVLGQFLIILFALIYAAISFEQRYYGEVVTYLCMSAPMAVIAAIEWLRHPHQGSSEVKVGKLTRRKLLCVGALAVVVTIAFYLILGALGNKNLLVSTLSVTTSFVAASLTALRSPYYAVGYLFNDVVLIVLWTLACLDDISYLSMVACFLVFLINDSYGFISWRRMERRQSNN